MDSTACVRSPYSLLNGDGSICTMTDEAYRNMITELLVRVVEDMGLNVWSQQDGATVHTARETVTLLTEIFQTVVYCNFTYPVY